MRHRPVVIIVVSLLLIAVATGFQLRGQILHLLDVNGAIPGSAPLASGSLWSCPSGWLNAYQSSMLFYPSNHPASPPLATKPTRCYRTDAEAKSAGYKLAPPPKGGAVLDGVYLVPSSSRVRINCEAAAAQLGIAFPCPTVLPLEVADSFCPPLFPGCTNGGDLAAVIALRTPLDFPGARLAFQAFPARREIRLLLSAARLSSTFGQLLNECTRGNFGPTVMNRPTFWATCNTPSIEFPGPIPTGLTWEVDNWIYQVGADVPPTPATRRITEFFASKLVAVSTVGG
jgi:hypothetical protein